jgi:hypothetical protein
MKGSTDYEMVTTDFPHHTPNPVTFAPTVVFSSLLVWFLGGGTRAGDVGKITVLHVTTSYGALRLGASRAPF